MAQARHAGFMRGHKSFAKRMSNHVAFALVVYTLMLIFVVTPKVETKGMSIFPYFLLVIFVVGVIPFFRSLDRRWRVLEDSELGDSGLKTRFSIDRAKLWIVAVGVPVGLAFACVTLRGIF